MSVSMTRPATSPVRFRLFVDFWNFQLSLKNCDHSLKTDWANLSNVLIAAAVSKVGGLVHAEYEGMYVYVSFDPRNPNDSKLVNWSKKFLDKLPGVNVLLSERQKKRSGPRCPNCHDIVANCPACGADMRGTEEKGVDTLIATHMVSLAWEQAYDVAILVSADRDFVPVVEYLQTKGKKVIHGGFPPNGAHLSEKCWAHIDIAAIKEGFRRT
jgi:uncharacterized LabA/DUF88 family protein